MEEIREGDLKMIREAQEREETLSNNSRSPALRVD